MKLQLERQIEELLTLEIGADTLSEILFSQTGGLFGQMAASKSERRVVSQTSLFQRAQQRVWELAERDSAKLRAEVALVNEALDRGRAASSHVSPGRNGPARLTAETPIQAAVV